VKPLGRLFNLSLGLSLFFLYGCIDWASAQESREEQPLTHIIEVEQGVNLHIVEWGGTGPPILFVPSWSATSRL
jgi:hypothetical protein